MADSKRVSVSVTLPSADIMYEEVALDLRNALSAAGVSIVTASPASQAGAVVQLYFDALVPTGQADATTITAVTNAVNGLSLDGVPLVAGTVTCLTTPAEATPVAS